MQLRPFQSAIKIILISGLLHLLPLHPKAPINQLADRKHKPSLGVSACKKAASPTKTNLINNSVIIQDLKITNNRRAGDQDEKTQTTIVSEIH